MMTPEQAMSTLFGGAMDPEKIVGWDIHFGDEDLRPPTQTYLVLHYAGPCPFGGGGMSVLVIEDEV